MSLSDLGMLQEILSASDAMIARAGMRIPGFANPAPFEYDLRMLQDNQANLRRQLNIESQQIAGAGNLGLVLLVAGGVLAAGAIGTRIYKHFTDSKRLDAQTELYTDIVDETGDKEKAAKLVFGMPTDWSSIMTKAIVITAIVAGVVLVVKLK